MPDYKAMRLAAGLTQEKLAEYAHMRPASISRLENGKFKTSRKLDLYFLTVAEDPRALASKWLEEENKDGL